MMGAASGKRREDVEAGHSKAQHALILAFFSKDGGITRSEPADTDLTGLIRKETGLMNRISCYNLHPWRSKWGMSVEIDDQSA